MRLHQILFPSSRTTQARQSSNEPEHVRYALRVHDDDVKQRTTCARLRARTRTAANKCSCVRLFFCVYRASQMVDDPVSPSAAFLQSASKTPHRRDTLCGRYLPIEYEYDRRRRGGVATDDAAFSSGLRGGPSLPICTAIVAACVVLDASFTM